MTHYTQQFSNKYPELNELLAVKDWLLSPLLRKNKNPKRKVLSHRKPFACLLSVFVTEGFHHVVTWAAIWGMGYGLKFLLNPLGTPNYF